MLFRTRALIYDLTTFAFVFFPHNNHGELLVPEFFFMVIRSTNQSRAVTQSCDSAVLCGVSPPG